MEDEMNEVQKSAKAYLENKYKEIKSITLKEKLATFSDPFISDKGELCINLRTYPRRKNIRGLKIKTSGIIINIETRQDVEDFIEHILNVFEERELLRDVAEARVKRWKEKRVV